MVWSAITTGKGLGREEITGLFAKSRFNRKYSTFSWCEEDLAVPEVIFILFIFLFTIPKHVLVLTSYYFVVLGVRIFTDERMILSDKSNEMILSDAQFWQQRASDWRRTTNIRRQASWSFEFGKLIEYVQITSSLHKDRFYSQYSFVCVVCDLDCSMSQLAVAWCLKNDSVNCLLLGASSVEQFKENIHALQVTWTNIFFIWYLVWRIRFRKLFCWVFSGMVAISLKRNISLPLVFFL